LRKLIIVFRYAKKQNSLGPSDVSKSPKRYPLNPWLSRNVTVLTVFFHDRQTRRLTPDESANFAALDTAVEYAVKLAGGGARARRLAEVPPGRHWRDGPRRLLAWRAPAFRCAGRRRAPPAKASTCRHCYGSSLELVVNGLAHPASDIGRLLIHGKPGAPFKSMWSGNDHTHLTAGQITRNPTFVWLLDVLAASRNGGFNPLSSMCRNTFGVEYRVGTFAEDE